MSKEIVVYTDGSCLGNNQKGTFPGGWAAVVLEDGKELEVLKGNKENTTNSAMEVMAAYSSLVHINNNFEPGTNVKIFSDSKYVCNSINSWLQKWSCNGWMNSKKLEIAHVNLWKEINEILKKFNVLAEYVEAHKGNKYNELCDTYAKEEANKIKTWGSIPLIFIDFETTGVSEKKDHVLSVCAIRAIVDLDKMEVVDCDDVEPYIRYYYSESGCYDPRAVAVNGLTHKTITEFRGDATYPEFYRNDLTSIEKYCKGIKHFVAHNSTFDRRFSKMHWTYSFCTCGTNTSVMRLPLNKFHPNFKYKKPTLLEAAHYYNVKFNQENLHDAAFDADICRQVFEGMLSNEETKEKVVDFLIV